MLANLTCRVKIEEPELLAVLEAVKKFRDGNTHFTPDVQPIVDAFDALRQNKAGKVFFEVKNNE
jgi:hypothetical protein